MEKDYIFKLLRVVLAISVAKPIVVAVYGLATCCGELRTETVATQETPVATIQQVTATELTLPKEVEDAEEVSESEPSFEGDSTAAGSVEGKAPSHGVFIDPRDGQEYPWAEIGDLVWMTRNMDYGTMIALEAVTQTGGRISGNSKHCYEALCVLFGGLYSWEHAQSVCPKGWHLPSREEYEQLVQYATERCKSGECDAVKSLKSGNEWSSPGTDETGFSALGGGKCAIKDGEVSCSMRKSAGHWWTSSSVENQGVAMRITGQIAFPVQDKQNAYYSVRCVEDY